MKLAPVLCAGFLFLAQAAPGSRDAQGEAPTITALVTEAAGGRAWHVTSFRVTVTGEASLTESTRMEPFVARQTGDLPEFHTTRLFAYLATVDLPTEVTKKRMSHSGIYTATVELSDGTERVIAKSGDSDKTPDAWAFFAAMEGVQSRVMWRTECELPDTWDYDEIRAAVQAAIGIELSVDGPLVWQRLTNDDLDVDTCTVFARIPITGGTYLAVVTRDDERVPRWEVIGATHDLFGLVDLRSEPLSNETMLAALEQARWPLYPREDVPRLFGERPGAVWRAWDRGVCAGNWRAFVGEAPPAVLTER